MFSDANRRQPRHDPQMRSNPHLTSVQGPVTVDKQDGRQLSRCLDLFQQGQNDGDFTQGQKPGDVRETHLVFMRGRPHQFARVEIHQGVGCDGAIRSGVRDIDTPDQTLTEELTVDGGGQR